MCISIKRWSETKKLILRENECHRNKDAENYHGGHGEKFIPFVCSSKKKITISKDLEKISFLAKDDFSSR